MGVRTARKRAAARNRCKALQAEFGGGVPVVNPAHAFQYSKAVTNLSKQMIQVSGSIAEFGREAQRSAVALEDYRERMVKTHPEFPEVIIDEYVRQMLDWERETGEMARAFPLDIDEIYVPLAVFAEAVGRPESTLRRKAKEYGAKKEGRRWLFPAGPTRMPTG